jgi:hypothetical protein
MPALRPRSPIAADDFPLDATIAVPDRLAVFVRLSKSLAAFWMVAEALFSAVRRNFSSCAVAILKLPSEICDPAVEFVYRHLLNFGNGFA